MLNRYNKKRGLNLMETYRYTSFSILGIEFGSKTCIFRRPGCVGGFGGVSGELLVCRCVIGC